MYKKPVKFVFVSLFIILFSTVAEPVSALSGLYDEQFYKDNGVLYYNPEQSGCLTSDNIAAEIDNKDYSGAVTVFSGTELGAIADNIEIYTEAANGAGIPWQLLAAIHYRATHMSRSGPSGGGGPYQVPGATDYPLGDYSEKQFKDATEKAAKVLKEKADEKDLKENDNIKFVLYNYGGADTMYETQATALGFTTEQAKNGEGAPFVMNRADAVRDPAIEPASTGEVWGEIDPIQKAIVYPATDNFGTFVIYSALSKVECNTGGLVSGGMNLEQAKAFMEAYKDIDRGDPKGDAKYMAGTISCDYLPGQTVNCVAFSLFFLNKYTTLRRGSSDGGKLVGAIAAVNPTVETGTVPRPYSIFSVASGATLCDGVPCGHTGVVLGVDTARNVVIIGEAAWCQPGFTAAREKNLTTWSSGTYRYIYTDKNINPDGGLN